MREKSLTTFVLNGPLFLGAMFAFSHGVRPWLVSVSQLEDWCERPPQRRAPRPCLKPRTPLDSPLDPLLDPAALPVVRAPRLAPAAARPRPTRWSRILPLCLAAQLPPARPVATRHSTQRARPCRVSPATERADRYH